MRVITSPDNYTLNPDEISLFLAGGITNCPNWQKEIIDLLKQDDTLDKLVVFNPRRENFPIHNPNAAYEQIEWEFTCLEQADIFSMYFCGGVSDQPICMYELGRYISRMQSKYPRTWFFRLVVTVESDYNRKLDVLAQMDLACHGLFVNVGLSASDAQEYHTHKIKKAYKYLINLPVSLRKV